MLCKVMLSGVLFFSFTSQVFAESLLEAAKRFRSEVEVSAAEHLQAAERADESIALPMGTVFNQKGTLWCWGFSTFHMLRTFYQNVASDGPVFDAWRDAVDSLDSSEKFRAFMGAYYAHGQTGYPKIFLARLEQTKQLQAQTWTTYIPNGSKEMNDSVFARELAAPVKRLPRPQVLARIHDSLAAGAPTAYCGGVHCVTIYGGTYNNGVAETYLIADSLNKGKYVGSAPRIDARLKEILTLGE